MHYIVDNVIDLDMYLTRPQEAAFVRPASHWREEVIDGFNAETTKYDPRLPWCDDFAMRQGELTIWAGINGHGKSALLSYVALSAMAAGERFCIASMELSPKRQLMRMARQATGVFEPSPTDIDSFCKWTDGRLWLYNQQGMVERSRIIALGNYVSSEIQCTHLIIDSLLKCGLAEDDYNGQKAFVDELFALSKDTGLHVHLVHHMRKGKSEHDIPDKHDTKGSGAIVDQTDNLIVCWHNKRKAEKLMEDPYDTEAKQEPDYLALVKKQRNGEWEGAIKLWSHKPSLQFHGSDNARPVRWVDFV